jgi:ribosomal protein S18 acetylase RimI-like enzyme
VKLLAPDQIVIRPATFADLPEIVRLERESFKEDRWSVDDYVEDAIRTHRFCWVLTEQDVVAGVLWVEGRKSFYVTSIAVSRKHQRRGHGKRLMMVLLGYARALGVPRISLHVRKQNRKAIGMYEDLGFIRRRTVQRYYGRGTAFLYEMKVV